MSKNKQKGRKELPRQNARNIEGIRDTRKCQQTSSCGQADNNTTEKTNISTDDNKMKKCCPLKERLYQPFTVICNKELVSKVKAIAQKEGLCINAVVQAMYAEGIRRYEEKHGTIGSDSRRKSAKEVLFDP